MIFGRRLFIDKKTRDKIKIIKQKRLVHYFNEQFAVENTWKNIEKRKRLFRLNQNLISVELNNLFLIGEKSECV